MKQSILWMVGLLVLVAVIIGAAVLYDQLAPEFAPDRLTVLPPATSEGGSNAAAPTDQSDPSEQTPDTPAAPDTPEHQPGTPENNQASTVSVPDFTVLDADGNPCKLSDFFGKSIVLNFWASWCGYCLLEMPDFERAASEHPEITFMMINVTDGSRETMEDAKAFIEQSGYTFPVYYDTTLQAAITYGANTLPITFFIDKNGKLAGYVNGIINADTLALGISKISE
jgi:peroxiredoxin